MPYVGRRGGAGDGGHRHLILVGARKPVTFFAYPDKPSTRSPDAAEMHVLARPEQDPLDALARLADALGAPKVGGARRWPRPEPARGAMTPETVARDGGGADAGERDRRRRVGHLRPRFFPATEAPRRTTG